MAREVYVLRDGKLVPKHLASPPRAAAGPQVISDFADSVWCPIDGRHYSSKRHFRDVARAHGCIAVGNEKLTRPMIKSHEPTGIVEDVRRAMGE